MLCWREEVLGPWRKGVLPILSDVSEGTGKAHSLCCCIFERRKWKDVEKTKK
uniref:Uncharacterized protein n=1 Tax=Rhizophora mucronata TaxID=61149 RepID=A0A2P2P0P5_RHIMU